MTRTTQLVAFIFVVALVIVFLNHLVNSPVVQQWPPIVRVVLLSVGATILLNVFLATLSPSSGSGLMLVV